MLTVRKGINTLIRFYDKFSIANWDKAQVWFAEVFAMRKFDRNENRDENENRNNEWIKIFQFWYFACY